MQPVLSSPDGEPACRQAGLVDAAGSKSAAFTGVLVRKNSSFMFYVYAIKSLSTTYIYVGMTIDLERRLIEHNKGENRSTKAYRPFVLIYSEQVETRMQARKREKYLKSGIGKEYLKSLLK